MIDKALEFLQTELNAYLDVRTGSTDSGIMRVRLVPPIKADGQINFDSADNVYLSLAKVEEERMGKKQSPYPADYGPDHDSTYNPAIKLNLFLLFSAHFNDYKESLKYLYFIVAFFQRKNVFLQEEYEDLDPAIEKLILDLYSPTFEQQNHLWGTLGAKYQPSVLYKLRLLVIDEQVPTGNAPPILERHITRLEEISDG